MLKRYLHAATVTAALLALASLGTAAEEKPMHTMEHHDVTITHLVETAQTKADHEAVAKRFEEEAAQFDKKAAEHQRSMRVSSISLHRVLAPRAVVFSSRHEYRRRPIESRHELRHRGCQPAPCRARRRPGARTRRERGRRGDCRQRGHGPRRTAHERHRRRSVRHGVRGRRRQADRDQRERMGAERVDARASTIAGHPPDAGERDSCGHRAWRCCRCSSACRRC